MQIVKWFSDKINEINLYELLIYSRNKRYYFVDDVSRFKTDSNIIFFALLHGKFA